MKQRFKIFSSDSHGLLEEEMNKWLDEHPNVRIRRTQLAQSSIIKKGDPSYNTGSEHINIFTALVNYEIDEKEIP